MEGLDFWKLLFHIKDLPYKKTQKLLCRNIVWRTKLAHNQVNIAITIHRQWGSRDSNGKMNKKTTFKHFCPRKSLTFHKAAVFYLQAPLIELFPLPISQLTLNTLPLLYFTGQPNVSKMFSMSGLR